MNENEILDTPDFHHSIPVQIRFNDIDMLGHVNNTVYFSFFDLGKARYFEEVKKGHFDLSHIDIVVANINVNFLAHNMALYNIVKAVNSADYVDQLHFFN